MDTIMPSPTPSPLAFLQQVQQLDNIDWGTIVTQILSIVSSTTNHPILSMIGVGVVSLLGGLAYWFFKDKIDAWLAKMATDATNQGKTDWVDTNTPIAKIDTNKDNDNKGKIDGAS